MQPISPSRLRSLKTRLAVWVILPLLMVIIAGLVTAHHDSGRIATLVQRQLLHGAAAMISEQLTVSEGAYEFSAPPAAFELLRNRFRDRVLYAIHTPDGHLVAGDDRLPPYTGRLGPEGETFFLTTLHGERVEVIAYAYVIPSSHAGDSVITQVAQTLRGHEQFRSDFLQSTIRHYLYFLAAVLVFLAIALRGMFRPLVKFSAALQARQPGSLEAFEEKDAPSELEPVIRAMNGYIERLDRTLKSYEKFVGDTAHHLRNAFAVIGSQANFARRAAGLNPVQREVLDAIRKTLGRCTRVVNQLLMLASLDQKTKTVSGETTPLRPVITSVIEELAPAGLQKGIELGVGTLDENASVRAPERLLQELLANLIGNAILHMGRAGHITVSAVSTEHEVALTVADDGIGIPEALREKVFERFFRIDESNPDGFGLGMAIVREICDSLGAKIALSSSAEGRGLRVDILFPRSTVIECG